MKNGGSQQENLPQKFRFLDRLFMQLMHFLSLFDYFHPSFLILEVFELRHKKIAFGEYCSKDIISMCVLYTYVLCTGMDFSRHTHTPFLSIALPSKKEITCQWIQNCSLPVAFENPGKSCPILCYHSFQQGAVTIMRVLDH